MTEEGSNEVSDRVVNRRSTQGSSSSMPSGASDGGADLKAGETQRLGVSVFVTLHRYQSLLEVHVTQDGILPTHPRVSYVVVEFASRFGCGLRRIMNSSGIPSESVGAKRASWWWSPWVLVSSGVDLSESVLLPLERRSSETQTRLGISGMRKSTRRPGLRLAVVFPSKLVDWVGIADRSLLRFQCKNAWVCLPQIRVDD